jgi:PhzF family phenazine biosynthesis protein
MPVPLYHINSFTNQLFHGNPAAVCPLEQWLPTATMQAIARENGLSETAFLVQTHPQRFHLRWFTPDYEIDLCGHGTLAAAFVLFNCLGYNHARVHFDTLSGELLVSRENDWIVMDFPVRIAEPCQPLASLSTALGLNIIDSLRYGEKYLIVVDSAEAIRQLQPNYPALANCGIDTIIVTAQDTDYDFVSRYFHPNETIQEDPVTGSAHCILAPYWATRLNKQHFRAYQASPRGGEVFCEIRNDRVLLKGEAILYAQGNIIL